MAETWLPNAGLWKRRGRPNIDPQPPAAALPFMPAVHFHAVWTRTDVGTNHGFTTTHTDILTKLKAMGTKTVRIDTSWDAWQHTKAAFASRVYNGKLDDTLSWLRDNGMRALVTCNQSPPWATTTGVLNRLPDNAADMLPIGSYMATYLAAWGDTIAGIEVWNEPSLSDFDDIGPRPEHYMDCLHQFWLGAKSGAGKNVPIVFGAPDACAVAPPGQAPTSKRNHFISYAYDYMNTALGGLRPYDVMAFHCYPGVDAAAVASNGTQFWRLRHFEYLRARMATEGDTRPVFITELGYSAHSNLAIEAGAQPPWQIGVTDADQATLTSDLYQYVVDHYPEIKMATCYNEWEKGDPATATTYANRHQYGFGILKFADRATTKPIYAALKAKFPTLVSDPPVTVPPWPDVVTLLSNVTPAASELTGASGIVMSAIHDDIAYVQADHGTNKVRMINVRTGQVVGTITLTGATVLDWEDITRGPGNTIVVGDIGDNAYTRTNYRLYSFPEPATLGDATVSPVVWPISYSDGSQHNCESLLWDPTSGRFYTHSKVGGVDTTGKWCEGPVSMSTSGNVFAVTSRAHTTAAPNTNSFGGDFTPDGTKYALQRVGRVSVYSRTGVLQAEYPYNMSVLPQAEACGWVPEATGLLLTSEQFSSPPIYFIPTA